MSWKILKLETVRDWVPDVRGDDPRLLHHACSHHRPRRNQAGRRSERSRVLVFAPVIVIFRAALHTLLLDTLAPTTVVLIAPNCGRVVRSPRPAHVSQFLSNSDHESPEQYSRYKKRRKCRTAPMRLGRWPTIQQNEPFKRDLERVPAQRHKIRGRTAPDLGLCNTPSPHVRARTPEQIPIRRAGPAGARKRSGASTAHIRGQNRTATSSRQ